MKKKTKEPVTNKQIGYGLLITGILILSWFFTNNFVYHLSVNWSSAGLQAIDLAMSNWYKFGFNLYSVLFSLMVVFILVSVIAYQIEKMRKNIRPAQEHGSAKQGDVKTDSQELSSHTDSDIILSKNMRLDMNTRHTNLNNNVMVIGDSGSWKTMSYVKPNLLQMHSNYIVVDPKGAVAEEVGNAFKNEHYEIRYLNTVDMEKSMGYNPFAYFKEPADIQKFVNNLIENTDREDKTAGGDPFFDKAEITLITALCFYVRHVFSSDPEYCNFNSVMDLLLQAEAREDDEEYKSPLDELFEKLQGEVDLLKKSGAPFEVYTFGELACKNYQIFKMGSGKTIKSVLISVGVRLNMFNLPELKKILAKDELHLERLGQPMVKSKTNPDDLSLDISKHDYELYKGESYESLPEDRLRKMILFIIVSDADSTFSFLTAIILQQMYDQLYRIADGRKSHQLPIHVRVVNDEFANCGKQKDIEKKMATMRSRNISCSIILQGISQLKDLYKDKWEGIFENCPTTLFLGGKGPTTTEMLSKIIGNETVVYQSTTRTKGQSGSYSETDQIYQRPLYGPDEINRIPLNHCLIHIRGRQIYEDEKYNLFDHPNIAQTVHNKDPEKAKSNHFDIFTYKEAMEQTEAKRNTDAAYSQHPDGFVDGNLNPLGSKLVYMSDEQLIKLIDSATEESSDDLIELLPAL